MRFQAPNGSPIVGTLERLTARANADEYSAAGEPIYTGDTTVFWDDQETVCRKIGNAPSIVYLAEDGEDYTFDQISPDRDGRELHHDAEGWYVVHPHEERDEQGFGSDGVSLGFDGRNHYATEAEAWAAFEAGDEG